MQAQTSADGGPAFPDERPPPGPRTHLDVRPALAEGNDPIATIMDAVAGLPPDGILVVVSPFDPEPLHHMLGGQGFSRTTRERGPDDWETTYWKVGDPDDPVVLDVRGLTPPEPMERTLAALEDLPPGRTLLQVIDRVPVFLLPLLDEQGYTYRIDHDARGVLVAISRQPPAP